MRQEQENEAVRATLRVEAIYAMGKALPLASLTNQVNFLLCFLLLMGPGRMLELVLWLVLFSVLTVESLRRWRRIRHRDKPKSVSDRALRRAVRLAFAAGATWGVFAAYYLPKASHLETLGILVLVAGTASAAVLVFYRLPRAAMAFMVPCLVPTFIAFATTGGVEQIPVLALFITYGTFLALASRRVYDAFKDHVVQQVRNEELVREAQASNRAKSLFIASVSHELRSPLNAIIGFSEHLMKAPPPATPEKDFKEQMAYIRQAGEHLLSIVNDLLRAAQLESGAYSLNEQEVDLEAVITRCLKLLRPQAEPRQLTLRAEPMAEPVLLWADEGNIVQILFNLIGNAIKFTPADGTVSVGAKRGPDGETVLWVADDGVGIPESAYAAIFEPFQQGEADLDRKQEGVGLGLFIVKALVELHGGTVALDSQTDIGTRVTLTFPADRCLGLEPVAAANAD